MCPEKAESQLPRTGKHGLIGGDLLSTGCFQARGAFCKSQKGCLVLGTVQGPAQGCRNTMSRAEVGALAWGTQPADSAWGPYWKPVPPRDHEPPPRAHFQSTAPRPAPEGSVTACMPPRPSACGMSADLSFTPPVSGLAGPTPPGLLRVGTAPLVAAGRSAALDSHLWNKPRVSVQNTTGWLPPTLWIQFFVALEAGSPRSRCGQSWFLLRRLSACRWRPSCFVFPWSSLCVLGGPPAYILLIKLPVLLG